MNPATVRGLRLLRPASGPCGSNLRSARCNTFIPACHIPSGQSSCGSTKPAMTPAQTSADLEHEPRVLPEGGQRFGTRQALAGGQFAESSADRRSHPMINTNC